MRIISWRLPGSWESRNQDSTAAQRDLSTGYKLARKAVWAHLTLPDSYFALVRQFPLTHIRDDDHLEAAQGVIDELLQEDLDDGAREYLDALTDLVESYEDEHVPIPDASEADVLRELLRSNGLSQARLAKQVGMAQSTISAVVNGTRSLTREQVILLARFFGVSPAAFLPA